MKYRNPYLAATLPQDIKEVALIDAALEEKFREALKVVGKSYNIKATTPIVCKMIDLVNNDTETGDWVYLADIFGHKIPAEVGLLLGRLLQKMKEDKDITEKNKWQALEFLAADYLAK